MSHNKIDKKILLITYHFPPSLAVGGMRLKSFVKHLPEFGWTPYVLTLDEKYIETKEKVSTSEFKYVKITRAGVLPTLRDFYLLLKKGFKKKSADKNSATESARTKSTERVDILPRRRLTRDLKRVIISLFITLPDEERNWIIPAIFSALKEIRKEKISVILTSGPPHSVQLVGLIVSILTNVKWIADFRDPWMTPFNKTLYMTSNLSNAIERWLEKKTLGRANLVLTTTERLRDKIRKVHSELHQSKFIYIPNGFDEEDFKELATAKKYDVFTISYTGSIYFGRSPEPIFKAIKELVDEKKIELTDIAIKLVGNCREIGGLSTSDMARSYGLDSVVHILDYVPRKKALAIIVKSHLALLLATKQPYQIPAKVYEYMGLGTMILALTDEGATGDLLKSTNAGEAIAPDNLQTIKEAIFDAYQHKNISEHDNVNARKKYIRSNIVKELIYELESIIEVKPD